MSSQPAGPQTTVRARVRARVVEPLAAMIFERAGELSQLVIDRFRVEVPELYRDADAIEAGRVSAEVSIRAVAEILQLDLDPRQTELPPPTIAYARDTARQGLPVASMLRTYRLAHALLWTIVVREVAVLAADRDELSLATELCAAVFFGYVDRALLLAEEVYAEERERFARSSAAVRAETIAAILDGRLTDAELASSRLRYDLRREHLGVWAWLEHGSEADDPHRVLEAAIAELGRVAGAAGSLSQPDGMYAAAGWISSSVRLDLAALEKVRLDPATFPEVRLSIGEPAPGVTGFRLTSRQASSARRVASLATRRPGSVTRYGRVALQALASADIDAAREYVRRELGPLAAGDDTTLRLVATLRAYLDEHCSRSRAAVRLGVHENTISYRIRQVEEILGRTVEADTLDLRVALALADIGRPR